mmetsp:Transcript_23039/g.51935  ORF Transcript_23039/g.51935 Transcript_23039/m.51935 type:complete len:342 (-) Transcript_23039:53-1078(-)
MGQGSGTAFVADPVAKLANPPSPGQGHSVVASYGSGNARRGSSSSNGLPGAEGVAMSHGDSLPGSGGGSTFPLRCGRCCVGDMKGTPIVDEHDQPFGPRLPPAPQFSAAAVAASLQPQSEAAPKRFVRDVRIPSGGIFSGQVSSTGRPHGEGTRQYPDGTVYEGQWTEGTADGEGQLRLGLPAGPQMGYNGQWVDGLKQGQGVELYSSGAEYRGFFKGGKREGSGTLTWASGASYRGDFHRGGFHGEGRLSWSDGREYSGQWRNGLMHGVGRYQWPDGKAHEGHYLEDRRHGPGVFSWPDGSQCKGRWELGKLHGSGTYLDSEGHSRHGRWEQGEQLYWTD